ncbi:ComF family protein, partial [Clavibacter lycopersici]
MPSPASTPSSRVPPAVRSALLDALAVVAPVSCAGCGAADRAVCAVCLAALGEGPHVRPLALAPVPAPRGCERARVVPVGCGSAYAAPWPAL